MRNLFLLICGSLFCLKAIAINAGEPLRDQDYPQMVRVYTYPEDEADKIKNPIDWCSGVVISDSAVLTAGHCVPDKDHPEGIVISILLYNNGHLQRFDSKKFVTPFIRKPTPDMYPQQSSSPGYVKGCYQGPVPLIKTAEADIALVFFPPKTFKHWIEIDRTEVLPGDHVSMYGFGFRNNSLVTPVLGPTLEKNGLSVSHSIVAERANDQRFSVLNSDSEKFADAGDSGGAVLRNNRLVGIISTREQKCEDRYGSDYAILNSIIRLNAKSTLSP